MQCIKNNIAVFSPHTSWDAVQGGVNDWLASAFHVNSSKPITESSTDASAGAGRIVKLEQSIKLNVAIENIKAHIGIPHLRLALAKGKKEGKSVNREPFMLIPTACISDSEISSVALCAGSGSSVLRGIKADLYLTGEMLHHDILDAAQKGIHVILCNHSDSERGFLRTFQKILQNTILQNCVEVIVSKVDCDPLKTI